MACSHPAAAGTNLIRLNEPTFQTDPRVNLYRVIDSTELAHLRSTGSYGSNPNGSGKYWALTLAGAKNFASHPVNSGCVITRTSLPRSVLNHGYFLTDPGRHAAGTSVFFSETHLPMVYGAMTQPVVI